MLSYLYLPSSHKLFLSLFCLGIQLAKEMVFDQLGRINALDPWTDLTSRCHLGYIHTDPVCDEHRTRKRRSNPEKWVKNIRKKSKGAGKAYIDSRGNEKRMKEPQPSDCRTCRYKCNTKFTEEDRGGICREYWQLEDYARQKDFILSNMDKFDVQRQRSRGERKRTKTQSVVYSFKKGSEVVRYASGSF